MKKTDIHEGIRYNIKGRTSLARKRRAHHYGSIQYQEKLKPATATWTGASKSGFLVFRECSTGLTFYVSSQGVLAPAEDEDIIAVDDDRLDELRKNGLDDNFRKQEIAEIRELLFGLGVEVKVPKENTHVLIEFDQLAKLKLVIIDTLTAQLGLDPE